MQPDETFIQHVKEVVSHLYDLSYLQTHPLMARLGVRSIGQQTAAHALRTTILQSLESLNLGGSIPFRSIQARTYNVLHLHYVERLTVKQVAYELGISGRQVYRDLQKGLEDLATVLWARRQRAPDDASVGERVEEREEGELVLSQAIQSEATHLIATVEEIPLHHLLERALEAVSRLAEQRGKQVELRLTTKSRTVYTDRMIARQVLINVLSHVIQHADEANLTLSVQGSGRGVTVVIGYTQQLTEDADALSTPLALARQLIEMQGEEWSLWQNQQGQRRISFTLGQPRQTKVLIIDDNEGLIDLFQRYLINHRYRVVSARDGTEGLRLAQELSPDVVILDVMMPGEDGWEVLQHLKTRPSTQQIAVVVCSIFHDPELAFSLGASEFLPKPVSQQQLLQSLERLDLS